MMRGLAKGGRLARCAVLCLAAATAQAQETVQTAGLAAPPEAAAAVAPVPQLLSRVVVEAAEPWLTGLTGLHTTDGLRALAVTNFGVVIEGRFQRDGAGRLTGFRPIQARQLSFPDGRALTNGFRAAEGLAVGRDGRLFVSFEYHTRVWTYRTPEALPQDLGAHEDFARLPNGRGLASLALAPDGALYAIPERPARMTHGFPSYRWQDGRWTGSFRMPSDGRFLPVGADFGPDGWLYVLEHEGPAQGGASQIRRFAVQGDRMGAGQVLMRSAPGQFGYLASLSVWRDRAGRLRATLVSDNGGTSGRPTEFVELLLPR
jgi:hypothetical protein